MKRRLIILVLVIALCLCLTGCKSSDYKKAVSLQEAGDFQAAADLFQALSDYQDSASRLETCHEYINYNNAISLQEEGNYQAAADLFAALDDFQDSASRLGTCNDYIAAIQAFNEAAAGLSEKNNALDTAIKGAEAVAYSEAKALDETLRPALETGISETKSARIEAPDLPVDLAAITEAAEQMVGVDYTTALASLSEKQDALDRSMRQYALVDNPNESYVISCLSRVPGVIDIAAATEDNDPNGQLHKAGGYTAAVYFSHENVNQSSVYGTSLIDKGTDAGGQVEVYATPEDAIKRDTYLSAFDGSVLSSGSHTVIGTCVIRTSNELKASQQRELEESIIAELTRIE